MCRRPFPAGSTVHRVRLNILSRSNGHRVRNEIVDSATGAPVAAEDPVKGYYPADESYVESDDE